MTRNLHLHRSNYSKLLRRDGSTRCKFCGTPIEFFDRYDGTRIPLTPEFPSRAIPERMRWYLHRGVAYPGSDGQYCRMPHPAVCPAVKHADLPDKVAEIVKVLAVRMRQAIESGEFTPYDEAATETDVESPEPEEAEDIRHIVAYHGTLRIGPCAIEDLQCIAVDFRTGERCDNGVYDVDEGEWQQVDIDTTHVAGRAGQMVLDRTQGRVWAWHVNDWQIARRWWTQRCPEHINSTQPDAVDNEFVPFHPVRHDDYILDSRPLGYERQKTEEVIVVHDGPRGGRTRCATCTNSTVATVPEGWLCWQCEKAARRRTRVHRRWTGQGP
ncbi:DUF6083 domain-containing protein [Streptomyces sp. YS415]|uniref:DUF6083 domain-containing protein n=1 Tax=Streptomyces sp. YS415 TaxID=2944806 RepID=UPI002021E17B|nr:DUF6083 domain-containing protein [Streptomyces sp. YS415]MCL7430153.1 DUF6083 domain-containing protein [Streptomyces sp. YS415]